MAVAEEDRKAAGDDVREAIAVHVGNSQGIRPTDRVFRRRPKVPSPAPSATSAAGSGLVKTRSGLPSPLRSAIASGESWNP